MNPNRKSGRRDRNVSAEPPQNNRKWTFAVIAVLAALTMAVFWQVRHHEFVEIDDELYIPRNPHVQQGFTAESVRWAVTSFYATNWHPVTWLSHMLDVRLFGLRPGGHHLVSVAIHLANAILLFLLLRRLTGDLWPGAFVAALFAVHPLDAESVAWVAERKNVLSTFFWLCALWLHAVYAARPNAVRYAAVWVALAVGLMAKPMLVMAPVTLLLLDYFL